MAEVDTSEWPWGIQGDHTQGEIELAGDFGTTPWVFENAFLRVRDDAVIFPGGIPGRYISIHGLGDRTAGVAILPLFDGDLVLCRNFRHALRRWEIEIPRGFVDGNETPLCAAERELHEEYGCKAQTMHFLGTMPTDASILALEVSIFLCQLTSAPILVGEHRRSPPLTVTLSEAHAMFASGSLRDPFLAFALTLARAKGLLSGP